MSLQQRRINRVKFFLIRTFGILYCLLFLFALFNGSSRVETSMLTFMSDPVILKAVDQNKCRINPDELGMVKVDFTLQLNISDVEADNRKVNTGGWWKPSDCSPWQKVAIIVPYRDRYEHLKIMLARLHPMLQKQKLHYRIFIIEQAGQDQFNRGKLMNIGVKEALKTEDFSCFIFHDVDLLPENDRNLYYCDDQIRHLSSAIDEMRYHVMYHSNVGGVSAVNRENFLRMNGFANAYWGWGNEDDDLSARAMEIGLKLTRPPNYIGYFKMVRHVKSSRSDHGYDLFLTWKSRWRSDGINTLNSSHYKVVANENERLYTHLLVDVGKPPDKPPIDDSMPRVSLFWFLTFFFP